MIYCVLPVVVCSYAVKSFLSPLTRSGGASRTALSAYQYRILDVPEGIQVKTFAQIGVSSRMLGDPAIGKFRLTSSIPAETMQKNMNDYVDQMVKSAKGRAVFNGYRNGVIPLHAMKEVADALVPFGIEQMLVELLNANSLEVRCHLPSVSAIHLLFFASLLPISHVERKENPWIWERVSSTSPSFCPTRWALVMKIRRPGGSPATPSGSPHSFSPSYMRPRKSRRNLVKRQA